jgi:hypothetical protein
LTENSLWFRDGNKNIYIFNKESAISLKPAPHLQAHALYLQHWKESVPVTISESMSFIASIWYKGNGETDDIALILELSHCSTQNFHFRKNLQVKGLFLILFHSEL